MASYDGLAESGNICRGTFNPQKILQGLEQLETTITYLKSFPPSELSDEIKTKIHHLVTSFQILQARLFRSRIGSKKLDELWEGNGMLKYLFEKCIQHYAVNDQLKCLTCDEWLQGTRAALKNHLESSKHICSFSENVHRDMLYYWRDIISHATTSAERDTEDGDLNIDDDKCLMLKYGRFIDFDGPNGMLFCKLCCVVIQKKNTSLQAHFKQNLHQELFKDAVNVIVGRTKNNVEKTKNKNIFFDNDSSSLPPLNCNNLKSLVNNNLELAAGLSSIQSTNENRENIESWYKDTTDKFIIEVLGDKSTCSKLYICCICQLRTTSFKKWQEHCFSDYHETRVQLFSNVSYYPCNCSTEMICPNYIREYHMNKNHQLLLDLFDGLQLTRQPLELSDDDNESSDDDNNNSDSSDSNKNDDLKSYLKSKISNHVDTSGVKPKIANGNNVTGTERKSAPPKSASKKPTRKVGEDHNSAAENSNGTPIGLSDIPDNTSDEDLIRAIQHFGSIHKIERVQPSFANVFIELREEFQSILYLGLTVNVKETVVKITDPILNSTSDSVANDSQTSKPVVSVQLPRSISVKLNDRSSFVKLVCDLMDKSEVAFAFSTTIRSDMEGAVSCPVKIVGSKALHLALDDASTLDLFVEIDDNYFGKKTELSAVELSARTIKLFNMLKKSEHFKDVEIVGDNVQVLKLLHIGTRKKCQIFCRDGLIVEKTNLSLVYLNCDIKLRQMVLIVVEWFREVGLRNVLPAYSILWMALFPLMTHSYLHPVFVLRNHNDSGRKMISGWDCRYTSTFNPKMRELPTIDQLVFSFFLFYSDPRNFDRKVLAPLTAEKFDHQRIRQKKLPPAYGRYCHLISTKSVRFFKLTNGLCLQDPLQLNYNLTKSLQGNSLNKFVAYCKESVACFDWSN